MQAGHCASSMKPGNGARSHDCPSICSEDKVCHGHSFFTASATSTSNLPLHALPSSLAEYRWRPGAVATLRFVVLVAVGKCA